MKTKGTFLSFISTEKKMRKEQMKAKAANKNTKVPTEPQQESKELAF
ncbi:hypothetical protein [Adhaeribacter aquaticus]|nr:hypothetical protein [Adhaeribacter aquaticus]